MFSLAPTDGNLRSPSVIQGSEAPAARNASHRRPRDMTRRELDAALKRRGWRKVLVWIEIGGGHSIGMIMIAGKINRRASLAYAIQQAKQYGLA